MSDKIVTDVERLNDAIQDIVNATAMLGVIQVIPDDARRSIASDVDKFTQSYEKLIDYSIELAFIIDKNNPETTAFLEAEGELRAMHDALLRERAHKIKLADSKLAEISSRLMALEESRTQYEKLSLRLGRDLEKITGNPGIVSKIQLEFDGFLSDISGKGENALHKDPVSSLLLNRLSTLYKKLSNPDFEQILKADFKACQKSLNDIGFEVKGLAKLHEKLLLEKSNLQAVTAKDYESLVYPKKLAAYKTFRDRLYDCRYALKDTPETLNMIAGFISARLHQSNHGVLTSLCNAMRGNHNLKNHGITIDTLKAPGLKSHLSALGMQASKPDIDVDTPKVMGIGKI